LLLWKEELLNTELYTKECDAPNTEIQCFYAELFIIYC